MHILPGETGRIFVKGHSLTHSCPELARLLRVRNDGVSRGCARVHPRGDQDRRHPVLHACRVAHRFSATGDEAKDMANVADVPTLD